MKKNIALKINNTQEADFCGQILKKIGISPFDPLCFRFGVSRNYLFVEDGRYFFAYKQVVDNAIGRGNVTLVKSWRKFIINYLGNFYYLCQNKEEKEKLIDIICKNGLNIKSNFISPIDMAHLYLEEWWGSLIFNNRKPENKQEISLDNLTLLINSVRRFNESSHCKTMKTENKTNKTINNTVIHLKDKKEKVAAKAYLEGFFKENNLDIRFCEEAFNYSNRDCIYFQINDQYTKVVSWYNKYKPEDYINTLSFSDLEEFAQLIKEEKKKEKSFTFQNGLVAKYNENNGSIIIGCKEKYYDFWLGLSNRIIELQEDFSMSSYRFPIAEVKDFKEWLENL